MLIPTPARPVALITGASGGIGRAIALALAGANEPFDVALHYHTKADAEETAAAIQSAGRVRAAAFQADLGASGAAEALVERVAAEFGPPIALVHAAGHLVEKPISFTKTEDWDGLFNVHAFAAAVLAKAVLRHARKSDRGRIVLLGSLAGHVGLGNGAAYAAAKGAVDGLCKSLAQEAARWGTTVNSIAPGFIETHMTAGHDAERREREIAATPLKRYGTPEEVAGLVAYLCSPLGGYVTGESIRIDGGLALG